MRRKVFAMTFKAKRTKIGKKKTASPAKVTKKAKRIVSQKERPRAGNVRNAEET
jgi:hypothetical protein